MYRGPPLYFSSLIALVVFMRTLEKMGSCRAEGYFVGDIGLYLHIVTKKKKCIILEMSVC